MSTTAHSEAAGRTLFDRLDRAMAGLSFINALLASFTIIAMMLLICADIAMRNLFSQPLYGVAEFVSYSVVGLVFMQLGSAIRNKRLISAVFLSDPLEKNRPGTFLTVQTIFNVIAFIVLSYAVRYLWSDFQGALEDGEFVGATGAYQLYVWPFKLIVAFGITCAVIELVLRLVNTFRETDKVTVSGKLVCFAIGFALTVGFVLLAEWLAYYGVDRLTIGFASLAILLALIGLGMPIAYALIVISFVGIWLVRGNLNVSINTLGISSSGAVRSYGFGVIPLFVLMGLLLEKAGVGRDAFQMLALGMRRVVGGLGIATVGANAIFASITGSSIASATVFSRIAVPPMIETGHSKKFSLGVVAGSSVLGMLIPPSLLMIVYGLLAEASIGDLFIAGILPGVLMAGLFSLLIYIMARYFPAFAGKAKGNVELEDMSIWDIARRLGPVIFIIVLVMGGIYAGFFSPTEAGAVGAFGAVLVALFRRKLDWSSFKDVIVETGAITAGLLFLMIAASAYGRMLTMSTIPMELASMIGAMSIGLIGFVLLYTVIVVLLGMILDSVSIMLILLPIALPILAPLGGDLIWFGIITVIAIEIGLLTPPFGLSVYVVKGSLPPGFASLGDIFAASAPFVIVMAVVTLAVIFIPWLATALL
jgi:C4-dicarboxylate transporter DctM subunit